MRQISKEEGKRNYLINSRVFCDCWGNYYLYSKKEMRRRRKCFIGMDHLEAEKKRITAKDAEKILRCDWYGDKLPKWLIIKYPQLTHGIPGKNKMNIQLVENILERKLIQGE